MGVTVDVQQSLLGLRGLCRNVGAFEGALRSKNRPIWTLFREGYRRTTRHHFPTLRLHLPSLHLENVFGILSRLNVLSLASIGQLD